MSNAAIKLDHQAQHIGQDMAAGKDQTVIATLPHRPNAAKWIERLQKQLHQGREKTLAGLFAGMQPNIKKAVFMAAGLTRHDLETPVDQMTGQQRHQLFVGIKRIEAFIKQLQHHSLYCIHAFNIGEKSPLKPATEQELQAIEQQKALQKKLYEEALQQQEQQNNI